MGANASFSELSATTFRNHKSKVVDNISARNALLKRVKDNGSYIHEDGGLTLTYPLDYASNQTYQRYSDWDTLNISPSEVITSVEYPWMQLAVHVVASGREIRINSGESNIVKLVAARLKNAIRTFTNNFSADLYSSGSLTNQIGGLQKIIADTNTNSVGGIDANLWSFWRNTVLDASDAVITPSATNFENGCMLPLWLSLDRGAGDSPDLIVMDSTYYTLFETGQLSLKRYNDTTKGTAGFTGLKYKSADVVFDSSASGTPSAHAYFINSQYFKVVAHSQADMDEVEAKVPLNQDGEIMPILWMGNVVCTNRALQGVIKA